MKSNVRGIQVIGKHFKLIIAGFLAFAALANQAWAGQYATVRGKVEFIRTHDPQNYSIWAPPLHWFTLEGVPSMGTCNTWNGRLLLVSRDKQEYALLLAALTSGSVVAVDVDDSIVVNGFCLALHTTIRAAGAPDVN
ncbi:hypothetical protein V4F39_06945 [Aquincola sp. MAHUQ-54]|uniref:Uncharacterized protein n=1 Tax=Aquincola agrisoli TaxID=3119538 RepID=A0AAW9QBA9_9BURK